MNTAIRIVFISSDASHIHDILLSTSQEEESIAQIPKVTMRSCKTSSEGPFISTYSNLSSAFEGYENHHLPNEITKL